MKLRGTVGKLEDVGDAVLVTVTNVRRKGQADWRSYMPALPFHVTHEIAQRSYPIGSVVEILIHPK